MHLVVAAWCAAIAGTLGWTVPQLIRVLPEPPADSQSAVDKVPYATLAATPGLAWKAAFASGLAGALLGGVLGADWSLLFLLYLCPVAVALAYVDWRLRLLPTAVIGPSYLVVGVLVVAAALLDGDLRRLIAAAVGWLALGGLYWLLWRFTPGMGYGDVRLSGLVGMTLGYFGGAALLIGGYAGFVLGVVLWVPMRVFRLTSDRTLPFGPFMLLGILVGIVGSQLAT